MGKEGGRRSGPSLQWEVRRWPSMQPTLGDAASLLRATLSQGCVPCFGQYPRSVQINPFPFCAQTVRTGKGRKGQCVKNEESKREGRCLLGQEGNGNARAIVGRVVYCVIIVVVALVVLFHDPWRLRWCSMPLSNRCADEP